MVFIFSFLKMFIILFFGHYKLTFKTVIKTDFLHMYSTMFFFSFLLFFCGITLVVFFDNYYMNMVIA